LTPAIPNTFIFETMEKRELRISYTEYANEAQLEGEERALLQKAKEASRSAYAPYSNFHVGAALILDNGTVVTGNNQENVAYPSGLCAERVAIFSAGSLYPDQRIKAIAITCKARDFTVDEPLSPCGACRQAIAEYETRHGAPIRIILSGETGIIRCVDSIRDLLPFMFKEDKLRK
jgi:cytidine deaminase